MEAYLQGIIPLIVVAGVIYIVFLIANPFTRSSKMKKVADEMGLKYKKGSGGFISGIFTTEKNIISGNYKNKDIKIYDLHSTTIFDGPKTVIKSNNQIIFSQDGVTNIGYLPTHKIKTIVEEFMQKENVNPTENIHTNTSSNDTSKKLSPRAKIATLIAAVIFFGLFSFENNLSNNQISIIVVFVAIFWLIFGFVNVNSRH